MTRHSEYLKEKILCEYCMCIISKAHREPHLKTIKHINNLTIKGGLRSKN